MLDTWQSAALSCTMQVERATVCDGLSVRQHTKLHWWLAGVWRGLIAVRGRASGTSIASGVLESAFLAVLVTILSLQSFSVGL